MLDEISTTEHVIDTSDVPGFDDAVDFDIPGFDPPKSEETVAAAAEPGQSPEEIAGESEDAAAPKEADAKPAPTAAAARTLKVLAGDTAVDLAENATLEWKVDGKQTPVTIRELLDNYAGKAGWEKRYQAVANDRKAFDSERRNFESSRDRQKSLVVDMYEKTKAGKTFEAVQSLIEMTGLKVDAREYVKQLRTSMIEQAQSMAGMTPEQRQVQEANEEREYIAAKYEKLNQQRAQEEAGKAFQAHMATVAEQNGVPYDELAQTMEYLKQAIRTSGGNPTQITPEYAVEHRRDVKAYEIARDAIAAIEPELLKGNLITDEARWDKLAKLAKAHPEFDAKEFADIYRESRQKKQAQAAVKKVTTAPGSTAAKASIRKPKDRTADALDFSKISKEDAIW